MKSASRKPAAKTGPQRSKAAERPVGSENIDPELFNVVAAFVHDPLRWFHTPNVEFEGRKPIELLGTDEERRVRDVIEAAKYGLFS